MLKMIIMILTIIRMSPRLHLPQLLENMQRFNQSKCYLVCSSISNKNLS